VHAEGLEVESHLTGCNRLASQDVMPAGAGRSLNNTTQGKAETHVAEIVNGQEEIRPLSPPQNHQIGTLPAQHAHRGEGIERDDFVIFESVPLDRMLCLLYLRRTISQRFAGHAPDWAARAAGRHCDIVCVNFYNSGIPYGVSEALQTRFRELGELTGKPLMIGEWSFKAMDSGLPNTRGAATPVETQTDRAVGYASFLSTAAANPYIVGAHWFIHSDQPFEGRFDGENSN